MLRLLENINFGGLVLGLYKRIMIRVIDIKKKALHSISRKQIG